MPRSNYDDDNDYRSGHSSRRNRSPDYYSGAGGGPAVGFGDPGRPFRDDEPFEREEMTLMPPAQNYGRANSVPPGNALAHRDGSQSPYERSRGGHSRRSHSRSAYDDDDGESRRDHRRSSPSPMSRARNTMEDNFSNSSAGIGAGILGAVVGGLVANKATDAAYNRGGKGGHQHHHNDDHAVPKAVSTILGAVAGGLGANAFAHHVEGEREKRRERERPLRSQNDDGDYYRRRSHSRRDDDYEDHDDRRRDDHRRYRD